MNKYYVYHRTVDGEDYYSTVLAVSYQDAKNHTRAKHLYLLNTSYFEMLAEQEVFKAIFDLAQKGEKIFDLDFKNKEILYGKDKKVLARYNDSTHTYTLV